MSTPRLAMEEITPSGGGARAAHQESSLPSVTSESADTGPTPGTVEAEGARHLTHAAATTCGLGLLSEAWERTHNELEELRRRVHECICAPEGSPEHRFAEAFLRAIARERQAALRGLTASRRVVSNTMRGREYAVSGPIDGVGVIQWERDGVILVQRTARRGESYSWGDRDGRMVAYIDHGAGACGEIVWEEKA